MPKIRRRIAITPFKEHIIYDYDSADLPPPLSDSAASKQLTLYENRPQGTPPPSQLGFYSKPKRPLLESLGTLSRIVGGVVPKPRTTRPPVVATPFPRKRKPATRVPTSSYTPTSTPYVRTKDVLVPSNKTSLSYTTPAGTPVPASEVFSRNGTLVTKAPPGESDFYYNTPYVRVSLVPGNTEISKTVTLDQPKQGVYVMSRRGKNALRSTMQRGGTIGTTRLAPTSVSRRISATSKPKFSSGALGIVISHKELITQLVSSATTLAYSATDLTINPGKSSTFPWLSTLAGNFDQYRFKMLKFHLVSNQPTTVGGRIGLGYDYDSTDLAPADRNEFFAMTHHTECAPWDSTTLSIPVDAKSRFVNSHTTTDSKLIDCGQVTLMSDTIAATSAALADVIVEYVVELIDAQQAIFSTMQFTNGAGTIPIAAFSNLLVVGPVVGQLVSTSSTTVMEVTLPQGYYSVVGAINDTGAGTPGLAVAVSGGVGFASGSTSTTDRIVNSIVKITTNLGKYRFTFSTVTIANLEVITLVFTRVSATYYVNSGYGSAMTTY